MRTLKESDKDFAESPVGQAIAEWLEMGILAPVEAALKFINARATVIRQSRENTQQIIKDWQGNE